MSDPHLNIFHAYRGASRTEDAQLRQLEDNLTRALMITIDRVQYSSEVRNVLVRALGVCEQDASSTYQCYLQVSQPSTSWPAKSKRQLLILHGGPALAIGSGQSDATSARLDGLISSPDFLLGIESKIGNSIDESQIERHCQLLGIDRDQVTDLTWSRLAREVSKIGHYPHPDSVASFVVEQFEEYLRMNGFGGFTAEHFSYFALPQSSRDDLVKDGIRRVLQVHGEAVASAMGDGWNAHVLNINAGVPVGAVAIEHGRRGRTPHLALTINPAGIDIFANIELQDPYARFARCWLESPHSLVEFFRQLGKERVLGPTSVPWGINVQRRVGLGRPRHYHYWKAADIALNAITDWPDDLTFQMLDRLFSRPDDEPVPEIMILRSYPAAMVQEKGEISDWLIRDTEQLKPFFSWLGMK